MAVSSSMGSPYSLISPKTYSSSGPLRSLSIASPP
jgi:hypothetical protein